jgi:hypothetical protein
MVMMHLRCMSYLIIDLTTDIRRLAAGLSHGSGRPNREMIADLIQVEQKLGKGLTDLEMQTQLWYLWVLLEELAANPRDYFDQQWENYQRIMVRIQSSAFRLGQRWAQVSQLRVPEPIPRRVGAMQERKRVYGLFSTKNENQ